MTKISGNSPMRTKTFAVLMFSLMLTLDFAPKCEAGSSYTEAVGLMKREQTLGEANAGLLKTFAKDDPGTFAQGIQLYAFAQAEFNGLLETLKGSLIEEVELANSKDFQDALAQAVERRVEFTNFVNEKVISSSPEGTRSLAAVISGDIIKGSAELLKVLKDAGFGIWNEYQKADAKKRQQISDQLDSLKWRSFDKVPALG